MTFYAIQAIKSKRYLVVTTVGGLTVVTWTLKMELASSWAHMSTAIVAAAQAMDAAAAAGDTSVPPKWDAVPVPGEDYPF